MASHEPFMKTLFIYDSSLVRYPVILLRWLYTMWHWLVVIITLFVSATLAYPAYSDTRLNREQLREARQQGHVKSLRWVLHQLAPNYPGHVLDADLFLRQEQYVYVIRLLQEQGYVTRLSVDAHTGEVLQVRTRKKEKRKK